MTNPKTAPDAAAPPIPFKVRLEPYLIESICELARFIRDKGTTQTDVSGLLYGVAENGSRTVGALKTFEDAGTRSDLARRERLEKAYLTAVEEAREDPELAALQLIGWFSFRNGSGLLSSDVVFHNQHFRKAEDLAVVVWREGAAQITAEVYSKSGPTAMTSTDYRWSSVRLSSEIRHMSEPIDLAMRVKLMDDSFLRAYETDEPEAAGGTWKTLANDTARRLMSFLQIRPNEEKMTARVRGLIGDGRLPNGPNWEPMHTAPETASEADTGSYDFRRFETPLGRRPGEPEPGRTVAAAAAAGAAVVGAPRMNGLQRIPDQRIATKLPPVSVLDLGHGIAAPARARMTQTEVSGLPMVIRPPKKQFPWPWAATIFVLFSAIVFGVLALSGLQGGNSRLAQGLRSLFVSGDLNLRVQSEDDRLRLTWNPRNSIVASATDGVLQIQDGTLHRDIHLEGRQVADGSVLYRPQSSDISFRLEVRGENGSTMGSVRVLDGPQGRQAPTLDVSDPQPADANAGSDQYASRFSDPGSSSTGRRANGGSEAIQIPVPATQRPLVRPATPKTVSTSSTSKGQSAEGGQTISALSASNRPAATPNPIAAAPGTSTINGWESTPEPVKRKRATTPAVSNAAEFVAPQPLLQVTPNTRSLGNGAIVNTTRVEVQVRVDSTGHVAFARVVNGGNVKRTVSDAALNAARQWTFQPATLRGQRIESDHTIFFEFRPQR